MGWFFRKSKSLGPFRLNFSKSGLGLSFGVKGARVSFSKRGTYVNLGANGIYYRQRIDRVDNTNSHFVPPINDSQGTDPLHTITTQNVDNVTDVDSRSFVDELQSKSKKTSLFKWLGLWPSILLFLYALSFSSDIVREEIHYKDVFTITKESVFIRADPTKGSAALSKTKAGDQFTIVTIDSSQWVKIYLDRSSTHSGFVRADMGSISNVVDTNTKITRAEDQPLLKYAYVFLAMILVMWCLYLKYVDKKRKTVEIYYTLDEEIGQLHQKFIQYFRHFSTSAKTWQKLHATGVSDAKYHAGASELVSRTPIGGVSLQKLPSPFLKTNISIPSLTLKNTELYFFPERLIIKRSDSFGAVFYKNITVEKSDVRFIESEAVPGDAIVIDHTWKYLNKSGGPDKRFSDNRQLPICLYSEYSFKSDGGLCEVITTSKHGAMDQFTEFLKLIGEYQRRLN